VICPGCKGAAEFKGHRAKQFVSLLGTIRFYRAYYHCDQCGAGLFPFDDEAGFGPHRVTPGAERVAGLLGLTCDGFEEAAEKLLPEACGLRLAESTVQRITEDAGARLGELQEGGHTLGDDKPFEWRKDARGRTCAYVSLDLTGVPQQAEDGGPAEGRMPYVAAIYNPVPEGAKPAKAEPLPTPGYEPVAEGPAPPDALPQPGAAGGPARPRMQARYVSGLLSLAALGLLRKEAAQVGMEKAEQWIALSDGGSGLENFERTNFNREDLVVILDFYHPASYLEALARAWWPNDEEKRVEQARQWCHALKHEGGAAMVKVLEGLALPKGKAVREAHQAALSYFRNNVHRMNYPHYRAQGWQIGSGPIESACKTVVGQRLKQAGMRWREYGTDNVCHLRALFKSEKDQWDAFWERKLN
jgi:Uncharacterised protein family (UPF0236)